MVSRLGLSLPALFCIAVILAGVAPFVRGNPRTAFACTGGPGTFESEAKSATLVAIVEVMDVGGHENSAPTMTPTPVGTPSLLPPNANPHRIPDLRGVGARLRVEQTIAGGVIKETEVDLQKRWRMEEQIRRVEANPDTVLPCEIDFLVQRYEVGERYLVFVHRDEIGENYTSLRFRLDGELALLGDPSSHLLVTEGVKDTYFAGLPAALFPDGFSEEALYVINVPRLPVQLLIDAVRGIRASTARGVLKVNVIVDGEDRSGGAFWFVVLPADYPQPVITEEVERYAHRTTNGRAEIIGLPPGDYLVAVILPSRFLKEPAPTSVVVEAPAWVRNSSDATVGYWPAYVVSLGSEPVAVTFVRVGYDPLPEGFVIPGTGGGPAGPEGTPVITPPDTGSAGLR